LSSCAQVWSIHKCVCGPGKANPFVWPLLSVDEAREAIEHMHESTGLLTRCPPERNTVAKALQDDMGIPSSQVPVRPRSSRGRLRLVPAVRQACRSTADSPCSHPQLMIDGVTAGRFPISAANFMRQQLLVATVRMLEHARRASLPTSVETLDTFRQRKLTSVWGAASDWDVNGAFDDSTTWEEHGTEPWRAKARHYVLMIRLVLLLCGRRSELEASLAAHRARLADYVRTAVAASSPKLAAELLVMMEKQERILQGLDE